MEIKVTRVGKENVKKFLTKKMILGEIIKGDSTIQLITPFYHGDH